MDHRRIAPTFMLPAEFPNLEVKDIYVVFRGGIDNVHITSAQDFRYHDKRRWFKDDETVLNASQMDYRVDHLENIQLVLDDLVLCNDGIVDWSMALEQGQRAHYALKNQLAGNRPDCMKMIIRFTKQGELYLPGIVT